MVSRGISCGRPRMSETTWGQRSPRVPPPTATSRRSWAPAARSVSTMWRTPKPVASSSARYRWPRPWLSVRPRIRPRAWGSSTGARSPAKYGSTTSPSAPGATAAASATSCSNGGPPAISRSQPVSAPDGRKAGRERAGAGEEAGGAPEPGVRLEPLDDLDDHQRGAVHQHHVAGLADVHAERLDPGVDRAGRRPGSAGRQAGLGGGCWGDLPDDLGRARPAAAAPGPARSRRPNPRPSGWSGSRRAGRTGWPSGGRGRTRRSAARTMNAVRHQELAGLRPDLRLVAAQPGSFGPTAWLESSVPPRARIASAPYRSVSSAISRVERLSMPYRMAGRSGCAIRVGGQQASGRCR